MDGRSPRGGGRRLIFGNWDGKLKERLVVEVGEEEAGNDVWNGRADGGHSRGRAVRGVNGVLCSVVGESSI